jgi:hypothetical protein
MTDPELDFGQKFTREIPVPIDRKALLDLWNVVDMPACDVGMELATKFLESCGEGVDRLGVEEPSDRITEMSAAYMTLVEHGADCDYCTEVGNVSNSKSQETKSEWPETLAKDAGI